MGCWSADTPSGVVLVDSRIASFMGMGVSELSYYQVLRLIDSRDRRCVKEAVNASRGGVPKNCSFDVKMAGRIFVIQITIDSVDGSRVGGFIKVERICELQDNQQSQAYVRMGVFDCRWQIAEKRIELTVSHKQLLTVTIDEFLKYIHCDDVREVYGVISSLEGSAATEGVINVKFRSKLLTGGNYRWYELRVEYADKPELSAVMLDVDVRRGENVEQTVVNDKVVKMSERQGEDVENSMSTSFMLVDMDYRLVWSTDSINLRCGNRRFVCGEPCYSSLFNRTEPCLRCPIVKVKMTQRAAVEIISRESRQIKISAEPVCHDDGSMSGVIVRLDDMTDIIHKERLIKELTLLMETILTYTPACIFIKDPNNDFRYLYWNKATADAVGVPTEDAVGKTDAEIFVDVMDVDHFREDDEKLLEGGVPMEFEECFFNAQGELRTTVTLKTLIPTEYKYPWIMGVAIDISSKKQQEIELIKAKEKAEESDRFKSSFIANMSHEIRTPLNSIVGFSELLGDMSLPEEDRAEYLEIIKNNNQLLLQLISDILDLSRLESRVMDLTFSRVDVNLLCARIAKSSTLLKEINVPIVIKNSMPQFYVCGDENRTQQVITNFVTNALKFTKQGCIEIGANPISDYELEIYVQDTGTGIDEQKLESVFERFVKLNKDVKGTGLGLSICRDLVELMGGRIGVESKVGVGSKFWFTLPIYKD